MSSIGTGMQVNAGGWWNIPPTPIFGAYDIGDAINFWSALASFASVHDFLCYTAGQRTRLPTNSILPIRKRGIWADELARLSGLTSQKCDAILQHIICRPNSVIDLHVTPFLPMDDKSAWLALAAPLAISGRFDQNLLRILLSRGSSAVQSKSHQTRRKGCAMN